MVDTKAEHAKLALSLWWVAQSTLKKFNSGSVPACLSSQLKPKYFKVKKVFAVFLDELFKPKVFLKVLFKALVHTKWKLSRNKTVGSCSKRLITHSQYSGGRNNTRGSFGTALDSWESKCKHERNGRVPLLLCRSGVAVKLQNIVHHVETFHTAWLPEEPVFLV